MLCDYDGLSACYKIVQLGHYSISLGLPYMLPTFTLRGLLGRIVQFVVSSTLFAERPEQSAFLADEGPGRIKFHDLAVRKDHDPIVVNDGISEDGRVVR